MKQPFPAWTWLLVAGVLAVAGCGVPAPVQPTGEGAPWSSWTGPDVERGQTYGFVPVGDDGYGPALGYVSVDREGRVLYVEYEVRLSGGSGSAVKFGYGLEPWRPIVEPLFADGAIYGHSEPRPVRISVVVTTTLSEEDRTTAWTAIENGLARAKEPQEVPIADCGEVIVRAGDRLARLNCGQGDQGWEAVIYQLDLIRNWARPPQAD